jgi:hypothetical protein
MFDALFGAPTSAEAIESRSTRTGGRRDDRRRELRHAEAF